MRYAILKNGSSKNPHIVEIDLDGAFVKIGEVYAIESARDLIDSANNNAGEQKIGPTKSHAYRLRQAVSNAMSSLSVSFIRNSIGRQFDADDLTNEIIRRYTGDDNG